MTTMMRCDVCGKEIGYSSAIVVTAYNYRGSLTHRLPYEYAKVGITGADLEKRSDLCYDCADAMMRFLDGRRKEKL